MGIPVTILVDQFVKLAMRKRCFIPRRARLLKTSYPLRSVGPRCFSSSVLARAYMIKAEWHGDAKEYSDALGNAEKALAMTSATRAVQRKAHRIVVDSYTEVKDYDQAIAWLQKWAPHDPSFRTKLNKEIQALREQQQVV